MEFVWKPHGQLLDATICFDRYRVHPTQGLAHEEREIHITPKSLGVLCTLARQAGQVVSKEELFRTVWPKSTVTDSTLTSCIQELRRALKDDARAPRYIETVHRRGFRFIAATSSPTQGHSTTAPALPSGRIVGRDAVLAQMIEASVRARHGSRQLVFVSGEPGIGKTALADAFASQVSSSGKWAIARAECVQHYGPGEAYQPLLEIVARLAQLPIREDLIAALRRLAPLWLAQLPALQLPSEATSLQRRIAGATPERMLRELTDALEAVAEQVPLVLCIEDLHWSDASTLDWLACFARRRERARVLIVSTYRPGEVQEAAHSPNSLAGDLLSRGLCVHVGLAPLDEEAVTRYVVESYSPAPGDRSGIETLARAVHRRSEGNPLFVVSLLNELLARGTLVQERDSWRVSVQLAESDRLLPTDLRRSIEQQIGRVKPDSLRLLEAASVLGTKFAAAAAAAGADVAPDEAEKTFGDLARARAILRDTGVAEWPDGTLCSTFEFVHALYADVLRDQLPAGRRVTLHRAVGLRLEAAAGTVAVENAAELAMHFDHGRDFVRAIRYHEHAAQNNLRRSALDSAERHFRRALELLTHLPASTERDEREIGLQIGLGNVLMQVGGWASPDVQTAYARAHELCSRHGVTQRLFPALWNLWVFNAARGGLDTARTIATQLHELACASNDPSSLLQAHHANWSTLYSLGDFSGCASHAGDGIRLYQTEIVDPGSLEYGSHDCGVCARMFNARTLVLFGEIDAAVRQVDEAVALADRLAHPFTQAFALTHAAAVHLERGAATTCREYGAAARAIAREGRFSLLDAWASCYLGAALAQLGDVDAGLSMLREGVDGARATGSEMFQSHLLGLLAAVQLQRGSIDDGLHSVAEALAISERTGERFYVAELHRIRGELHLASNAGDKGRSRAQQDLTEALAIARSQNAALPAFRAAAALERLGASTV